MMSALQHIDLAQKMLSDLDDDPKELAAAILSLKKKFQEMLYEPQKPEWDFDWLEEVYHSQPTVFAIDCVPTIHELLKKYWVRNDTVDILDFGASWAAGTNIIAQATSELVWCKTNVYAADITPGRDLYANLEFPKVKYINADAFSLGRTFDIVYCSHVIEHTTDPQEFIQKILNITGKFAIFYAPYKESNRSAAHRSEITEETFEGFKVHSSEIVKSYGWNGHRPDFNCILTVVSK